MSDNLECSPAYLGSWKQKPLGDENWNHMKLTKKAHMKILYIWHFWINTVTKECFIVHTARVAHVVRSTFLTCYLWLICNTEMNGWKWKLKPCHLFPSSRIGWTFKINTVYYMSFFLLELNHKQIMILQNLLAIHHCSPTLVQTNYCLWTIWNVRLLFAHNYMW